MKSINKMVRILGVVLFAGFFMLSGLLMAQNNTQKALEILDKMSANYKALDAYNALFIYRFINEMDGFEETVSGDLLVSGERFRLRLAGQEVFCDGETLWTYIEENNEVNIDYYYPEEMEMSPTRIYDAYKNGFNYQLVTSNSKEVLVNLQPEDEEENFTSIDLKIDPENFTLKGWVIKDKGGNEYHYAISRFETGIQPKGEDFIFNPQKYPGVEIIDLR
jgi:outer membrane lipoprotein-sorting protein